MSTVTFNYTDKDIVKRKTICYYTKELNNNRIQLCSIEEIHVKHPEAPEDAVIPTLIDTVVKEGSRSELHLATLMESMQKSIEEKYSEN